MARLDLSQPLSAGGVPHAHERAERRYWWWLGFLLGLPFSYPAPPLYWLGFVCLTAGLVRGVASPTPTDMLRGLFVGLLIAMALLSNIVGLLRANLDAVRVLTTSFFFLFFLFGPTVRYRRSLLDGFVQCMLLVAVLVITAAVALRIDEQGPLLFSVPELRLWGSPYFPDWPNYLAFLLSLAFMLNVLLFHRNVAAGVQLIAALLTTSRTPLISLALMFAAGALLVGRSSPVKTIATVCALVAALGYLSGAFEFEGDLVQRLFVFEDREDIYTFGLDMLSTSPLLGYGAVLLDKSVGFDGQPSFHNSYLDIALRHGLVALLLFIYLLIPPGRNLRVGGIRFAAVLLLFLIGSLFQNFLKHPHIILLYATLIGAGAEFSNGRANK